MIIESDGNSGWFIGEIDHLNASIHLTETWLDEYEEYQGPQHRLRWLLRTSTDAEAIGEGLKVALANRHRGSQKQVRSPQHHEWRKEQRAKNR